MKPGYQPRLEQASDEYFQCASDVREIQADCTVQSREFINECEETMRSLGCENNSSELGGGLARIDALYKLQSYIASIQHKPRGKRFPCFGLKSDKN